MRRIKLKKRVQRYPRHQRMWYTKFSKLVRKNWNKQNKAVGWLLRYCILWAQSRSTFHSAQLCILLPPGGMRTHPLWVKAGSIQGTQGKTQKCKKNYSDLRSLPKKQWHCIIKAQEKQRSALCSCGNPLHWKQCVLRVYIGLKSNHKFTEEKSKCYLDTGSSLILGKSKSLLLAPFPQPKPTKEPHNFGLLYFSSYFTYVTVTLN